MRTWTVAGDGIEAAVRPFGRAGAHLTVPVEWVGRRVRVVPVEEAPPP